MRTIMSSEVLFFGMFQSIFKNVSIFMTLVVSFENTG
jgi:hypothetical protein